MLTWSKTKLDFGEQIEIKNQAVLDGWLVETPEAIMQLLVSARSTCIFKSKTRGHW